MISKRKVLKFCAASARRVKRPYETQKLHFSDVIQHRSSVGVGVVGFLEDGNSSFMRGASKGPPLIREKFHCHSSNQFCEFGVNILDHMQDFGDFQAPGPNELCPVQSFMEDIVLKNNLVPLTLGGDHSISYPLVRSLVYCTKAPVTIVHFDAHPDLYPTFEDNPSSHASQFVRILEQTEQNNSALCEKLISIGIRTMNPIQKEQMCKYDVTVVEAKDVPTDSAVLAQLMSKYITHDDTRVYISFDMDVLEPGMAPGVAHREPGGLTVRQALDAIEAIPGIIVGADIVEFNPDQDIAGITAAVAGKVMKQIISKIVRSQQQFLK